MFKASKSLTFVYNNKTYNVIINRKHIKNIYYRYKNDEIIVTSPFLITDKYILNSLNKYIPKLLNKTKKETPIKENNIYVFGEKYDLIKSNITKFDFDKFYYVNEIELNKYLKEMLYQYILGSYFNYLKLMNIKDEYKISIRNMKTRLGSNSRRTNKLAFSLSLIHYSKDIIDSVIVHELAHYYEFNHSFKFYNIVYKYCPNYKILRKKLIKGIYK